MKKIAISLFAIICMAVVALPASADSYTLNFQTGTGNVGGVEIFPYTFSSIVDLSNTPHTTQLNVQMMCIDFQRNIVAPESWTATAISILTPDTSDPLPDGPFSVDQLKALAILDAQIVAAQAASNAGLVSDLQFAAWRMTATGAEIAGNSGFDPNSSALLNAAEADVLLGSAYTGPGSDYGNYYYFDPTAWGTSGINAEDPSGVPQRFLVEILPTSPIVPHLSPAPEPSSLMLLGTGVLGIAGVTRRRFLKA